jgi:hypothetical protein
MQAVENEQVQPVQPEIKLVPISPTYDIVDDEPDEDGIVFHELKLTAKEFVDAVTAIDEAKANDTIEMNTDETI